MASIIIGKHSYQTQGHLPLVGVKAPNFSLTGIDLKDFSLNDFNGKKVVLNIFPSVDTPVCASSVRKFNEAIAEKKDAVVICISKDLPFAQSRFCGAEGLDHVVMGSEFRNSEFSDHYHTDFIEGPMKGLLSRAVIVINEEQRVSYVEQVLVISEEPDYKAALKALD